MYYSENFAIDKHFYKKLAAYHYTRAKTFLPLRFATTIAPALSGTPNTPLNNPLLSDHLSISR